MSKYKCEICGYIFDEQRENKQFDKLAFDWSCPACGAEKNKFKKV